MPHAIWNAVGVLSAISLPKSEATVLLEQLGSLLDWSDGEHLWKFSAPDPRVEVLLNDAGFAAAREVLSQDGWPVKKSWDHPGTQLSLE
jgi:hypothetical protein